MANRINYIVFDRDKLETFLSIKKISKQELSNKIGRSDSFISSCCCKGNMLEPSLLLMCSALGITPAEILPDPPKPEPSPEKKTEQKAPGCGYRIELNVLPASVKMTLLFRANGEDIEVSHAYSRIKGQRELDLTQAISYAAHMMYKNVEQKTLEKEKG